jgi:phospholipase C
LAANPAAEPHFKPRSGFLFPTPSVNGLSGDLLTNNPNSANPFRLDHSQASTCDQNHNYDAEQSAFDHRGLMEFYFHNHERAPPDHRAERQREGVEVDP